MDETAERDDPLRFGIGGTGNWGLEDGRNVMAEGRATVVAAADVSDDARANAVAEFDIDESSAYESYETMLESEALDAVVITTPHVFHYEQIVAALDRDLHVFCEKPLVIDVDDAKDVVRRAESGDRVVMPGFQRHVMPAYVAARDHWQRVDETPTSVTSTITQPWAGQFEDAWRADPDLSGGGYLYDTGTHLLDALMWVTDLTPASVSAEMEFVDDDERVDASASLLVTFEEGATASVTADGRGGVVDEHHHVWSGDTGTHISGRGWTNRDLRVIDAESDRIPNVDAMERRTKVGAFVDAITEGTEPPATVRDGLKVTAVTEAAYEAARTGERVPVDLTVD
ncbi:Gfo/Idh/MocA family protein [Candidatus Halobonum tyrrellensis]|uniref:Oxidoreductase domain-containing protein n=1 Tax=Candidatus Halobonum tyrrellensis G22 TaxID=1324957 RepID=V4HLR7_9EURY|nr:Gfo/Idh/MocA family oxidoreductase [Candidatus Halobonum tyrrellensis]ESP88844.1 oxidoreductase domain-containing protein [Candidatus Halobonum tyrrellensis G22]